MVTSITSELLKLNWSDPQIQNLEFMTISYYMPLQYFKAHPLISDIFWIILNNFTLRPLK
jgi:hypothetical protein